jgi:hypothetical protein
VAWVMRSAPANSLRSNEVIMEQATGVHLGTISTQYDRMESGVPDWGYPAPGSSMSAKMSFVSYYVLALRHAHAGTSKHLRTFKTRAEAGVRPNP